MYFKIKLLIILSFLSLFSKANDDSTGVILKNGKVCILHKVEAGQGLFGVARRYKTVWTIVRDANPGSDKQILPGQTLIIPTGKTEKQFFGNSTPKYSKSNIEYNKPEKPSTPSKDKTEEPSQSNTKKTSFTIFYTVKKGETLYSIAQKFGTTVDFLKQLNKLKVEKVEEGIDILVPMTEDSNPEVIIAQKEDEAKRLRRELDEVTAQLEAQKKQNKSEVEKTDESNTKSSDVEENSETNKKENTEVPEEDPVKKEETVPAPIITDYTIVTENFPEFDVEKVTETGFAKAITDASIDQTKDFVIHHSAPENTLILITNPANNKTIYAKVVKNFSRKENDAFIIQLTKNTMDYLELNKKDKFAIKISFAK